MATINIKEEDMVGMTTGKNKRFLTQTINNQLKKYGNSNIFSMRVDLEKNIAWISLGESDATFTKNSQGDWVKDYGFLYHEQQCTNVLNEIIKIYVRA